MEAPHPVIHCRQFRVPRRDRCLEECEDACAAAVERGRFAIADGASESAQSGLWARLLVEEFVHGQAGAWPGWAQQLQQRWAEQAVPPTGAQPWYVEEMHRHGAYSTFLGLIIDRPPPGEGTWRACAIGDSCLFHVRDDALQTAFPLQESKQFGTTPWLVGSRAPLEGVPVQQGQQCAGTWQPGDRLWLMTDALSRWFLEEWEEGQRPWRQLEDYLTQPEPAFADWVALLRQRRRLRDDDTSLLALSFG